MAAPTGPANPAQAATTLQAPPLASSTDDIEFSSDNGSTWSYTPVPDANGVDPAVTNVRINPKNAFNGNDAQFNVKLRMRVE